jgi:hypothetical protein
MLVSMVVRQQARPSVKTQNRADLVALKALVEAGKVMPVVGGTYRLGQTAEAIGHVAAGHARGTLVVSVRPSTEENHLPPTQQTRHADAESDAARVAVAS